MAHRFEGVRQKLNLPNWLTRESYIVAIFALLGVVIAWSMAFLSTIYIDININLWIPLWILHLLASLRVIYAGASAFRVERGLQSDQSANQEKRKPFQIFITNWLDVLRRTWSWSLIYALPLLVVTLWANVRLQPLWDLSGHVSFTLVFGYVIFIVVVVLNLALSAGLGILCAAIIRRGINAVALAIMLGALPVVFVIGITLIGAKCECEVLPSSFDFITTPMLSFVDGGVAPTLSLVVPASLESFDSVESRPSTRLQSAKEAFLYSVAFAVLACLARCCWRTNAKSIVVKTSVE